jgi:N-methylhydantoinase A
VGKPLSLGVEQAAAGVFRIAVSQTAAVVQLISTKRGVDPRDFAIVAYGGAGPVLACEVGRELGVGKVIVPVGAATFSAFGMMVADRKGDASATLMSSDPVAIAGEVEAKFRELEAVAAQRIGLDRQGATLRRTVYARYVGQRWELPVGIGSATFNAATWAQVTAAFNAEHERAYALRSDDMAVEMVQLHVEATASLQKPARLAFADGATTAGKPKRHTVWDGGSFVECAVLTRADFGSSRGRRGPALVEDPDTTIWVPPGATASIDPNSNLVIDLVASEARP